MQLEFLLFHSGFLQIYFSNSENFSERVLLISVFSLSYLQLVLWIHSCVTYSVVLWSEVIGLEWRNVFSAKLAYNSSVTKVN